MQLGGGGTRQGRLFWQKGRDEEGGGKLCLPFIHRKDDPKVFPVIRKIKKEGEKLVICGGRQASPLMNYTAKEGEVVFAEKKRKHFPSPRK